MTTQNTVNDSHALILKADHLSVAFESEQGPTQALHEISFDVYEGEILAIVGESGSGKSVTSLTTMGLLPENGRVTSGHLWYSPRDGDAIDLTTLDDEQSRILRGTRLGMIFQEPMTSLNPVLKVGDQLTEAARLHLKLSARKARDEALAMLSKVRIPSPERVMDEFPYSLSGGMRQRVMIAMALMTRPRLLIADEPTTALDVTVQAHVLEIIRELQREFGMSVIFITHDMGVVAELADRVVVMQAGRVVEQNSVHDIFTAPAHPYTQKLLAAVPRLGAMRGMPLPHSFEIPGESAAEAQASIDYTTDPLLEVDALEVRFPISSGWFGRARQEVLAVDRVPLKIWPGETLALVGESGSGKSTIGRALLRLAKSKQGFIQFADTRLDNLTDDQFRHWRGDMQMVFQDPYASLNPRLTVGFSIAEPLLIHKRVPSLNKAMPTVERLLEQVGLKAEHARRYPHEFSGGQRQRIAIARALALEPKLIVADEAVSALDVSIKAQVINLMMKLQRELGIAWLFISHDMAVVERIAHRVAVMHLGRIVEIAPREQLFAAPRHPYTKRLMEAVPIADPAQRHHRPVDTQEPRSAVIPRHQQQPPYHYREVGKQHWLFTEGNP